MGNEDAPYVLQHALIELPPKRPEHRRGAHRVLQA